MSTCTNRHWVRWIRSARQMVNFGLGVLKTIVNLIAARKVIFQRLWARKGACRVIFQPGTVLVEKRASKQLFLPNYQPNIYLRCDVHPSQHHAAWGTGILHIGSTEHSWRSLQVLPSFFLQRGRRGPGDLGYFLAKVRCPPWRNEWFPSNFRSLPGHGGVFEFRRRVPNFAVVRDRDTTGLPFRYDIYKCKAFV